MKRTMLLMLFACLCIQANAQSIETPERKYYYLQRTENQIFQLPFEMDHITDVIYPEILEERRVLAPNYPSTIGMDRDPQVRKDTFLTWIDQYPQEFEDYYNYLKAYVRIKMNSN